MHQDKENRITLSVATAFRFFTILAIVFAINVFVQESINAKETSSANYIQYSCHGRCGGFADRLKGIMSAYALSLISNRSFLIDMQWPCPIDDMFDTSQVNWRPRSKKLDKRTSETRMKIGYGRSEYLKIRKTNILDLLANSSNLLSIESGAMFMNAFADNPFLKKRINELGFKDPSKFKLQYVFHNWFNKLFKLKKEVAAEFELILRKVKKNIPGNKLICAQVRLGGVTRTSQNDRLFSKTGTSQLFWRFMNDTFLDRNKLNGSNYTIYVTSDNDEVKQEARDFFGVDKVVSFEKSNFHFDIDYNRGSPFTRFWTKRSNCKSIRKILLDFYLLRECDMAVASHSGFGLLGLLNRPDPGKDLYVYSNLDYIKRGVFSNKNLTFIKLDDLDEFNFSFSDI
jgi:hypothetical protein